jgi:hypothetical protein
MGSRVRIPLGAWMFVCCVVQCRADHSSRGVLPCVCMCVIKKTRKERPKFIQDYMCLWMKEWISCFWLPSWNFSTYKHHATREYKDVVNIFIESVLVYSQGGNPVSSRQSPQVANWPWTYVDIANISATFQTKDLSNFALNFIFVSIVQICSFICV